MLMEKTLSLGWSLFFIGNNKECRRPINIGWKFIWKFAILLNMLLVFNDVKTYGACMISLEDRKKILKIAEMYNVKRIMLFGSSTSADYEGRDIDLAVEGVRPEDFYSFYGDLIFSLSKPVDVVDLTGDSKFIRMINQEGVSLYG